MVVVAIGKTTEFASLGIDLEPNQPLPEDVSGYVTLPGEDAGAPVSRAVFVVKEAFYKAHCGLHHRMLDFTDVRITWEVEGFSARELHPPTDAIGPTSFDGTLAITAEWLAAFCAVSSK
jgi:4'-phosphopantetheinyl transferase EntD